ncbi:sensor histidine kinase [Devriesea agamarum]|uniref:sensor histidine kinase n=1 Tax=Devriesea agamarum TaxID=472569 RepID=UPI000A813936|nr:HAMP domain-containing sensor histidine kinase [Devriesea agamarum]
MRPRFFDSSRPVSLWTRFVALVAFVLIAGTLITGIASLFLLQRTLIQSVDRDLERAITPMVARANDERQPSELISFSPIDFVVEYQNTAGESEGRYTHAPQENVPVKFPPLTRAQVLALNGRQFTIVDSNDTRWRVMAVASNVPDGDSVLVALPLRSVDRTMHEMGIVVMIVGSLVVLVGMCTGGFLAHRALAPLRDVELTASQIAAGELSKRVPVTDSSYEVHQLGISLNEMLMHIERSFEAQAISENKATASEARMRRFVADASHELRTPLAAIRGFGELYRMGALTKDDDVASAMRRIEDEAQRMGSLVENLLRLARLDENPHVDLKPVDLTGALFDAAQDLRALDPARTVMVCSLAGTPLTVSPHVPVTVLGDEPALRQVILNLVGNANRHTPKGSPVELAIGTLRPGVIAFEVRDHGSGISPEQRERVFERFYRMDSSRQRKPTQGGGAGLGLSIVATIVEQHGGRVSIHETTGGGATFRVELRAAPDEHADEPVPDVTAPSEPTCSQRSGTAPTES